MPAVARTAPSTSGRPPRTGGGPAATARQARASAPAAIGTLTNITHRQPAYSVSRPPIRTPRAPPAAFIALHTPKARTRALPAGNVAVSSASAAGASAAAPMPCTARAATSWPGVLGEAADE